MEWWGLPPSSAKRLVMEATSASTGSSLSLPGGSNGMDSREGGRFLGRSGSKGRSFCSPEVSAAPGGSSSSSGVVTRREVFRSDLREKVGAGE